MRDWYGNSVIYSVDVKNFMDSNGDGVGDFEGLSGTLDYLRGLGTDCLWLLPIFASPHRDNGYDVCDYYSIDEQLGDFGNFAKFIEEAEDRGIRVMVDLPLNHTSIDHPWFQEAKRDRNSRFHDYYIWCDEPPDDEPPKIIFGKQQTGNWCYAPEVNRYYYHTFYNHEADLNLTNPRVREEIENIVRFWLRQGIYGFRLDAVPHMLREKGSMAHPGDAHRLLKDLRSFVDVQKPTSVLLAEVDVPPKEYREFFGEGDELHMALNFYLCNHIFLALARRDGEPIRQALETLPDIRGIGRWANFLRNHDELDLERLDKQGYEQALREFAPEEDMRAFGRGIRRRMAPMLQDDQRRLELAYSLLLTLPGTPVLLYGDEIGIGEDLSRKGRDAVRLLMQWSSERNGGFSTAESDELIHRAMADGSWGFRQRNVTDQRRDPASLLNWFSRAIHLRSDCPEFGRGELRLVETGDSRVFAHYCAMDHRFTLAVHNLSDQPVETDLDIPDQDTEYLLDLFGDRKYEPWEPGNKRVALEPYGYRWFRRTQFPKGERSEPDR
ncbi:trehalose synthase [Proteobacteria bacterium 005FR1]|nr:trehalose synthase [Proteobacteria bacterium 005FR1]